MLKIETELDEKGRVLIPKAMRAGIKKRRIFLISRNNEIRIVPKMSLRELKGISPSINLKGLRDERDHSI